MFNTIISKLAKQSSGQVSLVYCMAGAGCVSFLTSVKVALSNSQKHPSAFTLVFSFV